jgi:hypothetical protein
MKTRVMSLVTATVFALGVAGAAMAQTPTTPAPAQTTPPAKGGDTQMEKKDKKAADKQHAKKKHAAKKDGDVKAAPDTKAPETKAPEVKK